MEISVEYAFHTQSSTITSEILNTCSPQQTYSDDDHYDHLSALQKSIRGSDPNAALFYLMRMLKFGVDPLVICRRMIVMASEEIGLADPNMLALAIHTHESARIVGMPECELVLGHCAIALAKSPKNWVFVYIYCRNRQKPLNP